MFNACITRCRLRGSVMSRCLMGLLGMAAASTGTSAADVDGTAARKTPAPAATTAPATTLPADARKQIPTAIIQLGAPDFETRERAARILWKYGDRAIPALKEAVDSDDPETARRARGILDNFAHGIGPDTPQAVIEQLDKYRAGDARQKQEAL